MEDEEKSKTNWCQSVTGIVIREGKVLLARHTYGVGKGRLIVPGGYVEFGESPQEALKREFYEETKIRVEPRRILAVRFNTKDWYIAFAADYISGEASSDHDENDLVVWMDVEEALHRDEVPDLTKKLIECAIRPGSGLVPLPYTSISRHGQGYLFGIPEEET